MSKRCLYTIEFSDGSIYVGITQNLDRRMNQHKSRGLLKDKLKNTEYKITHTEYELERGEASRKEKEEIKRHKEIGSKLLNRDSGGSIGYYLPPNVEPKRPVTIRMGESLIDRLAVEAENLNITFSSLVIEILEAQLNGNRFSKIDFLVRKTFRRVSE